MLETHRVLDGQQTIHGDANPTVKTSNAGGLVACDTLSFE